MTKSRNRKLIRMTPTDDLREQNGFNFSDHKKYFNQVDTELKHQTAIMAERAKFT